MSELHFEFEYVKSLDPVRLDFFYKEAKRQRIDKAFCLYDLVRTFTMEKDDTKDVFERLKEGLNPHKVKHEFTQREVLTGWDELRARRR